MSNDVGSHGPLAQMTLAELEMELVAHAVCEARSMARLMVVLSEWDHRKGYEVGGCASPEEWLGFHCGLARVAAGERVRAARALDGLPVTLAALAEGRLSWSKVRALTRVASIDTEAALVELAGQTTAAGLDRIVRSYKQAGGASERAGQQRCAQRGLRTRTLENGMVELVIRLLPEEGEPIVELINERVQGLRTIDPDREWSEVAADVFVDQWHGDEATATELMVHVDAEVLADAVAGSGRCCTHQGTGLSASAMRRVACDATVVPVVHDDTTIEVGRSRRAPSPAQRRALRVRDRHCRFPGCTKHRNLHAHHIIHWADGGPTVLSNLVMVCSFHHRVLHDHGFNLVGTAESFEVTTPDGSIMSPKDAPFAVTAEWLTALVAPKPDRWALTATDAGPIDMGCILDALFTLENVPAGTS
jgi:Domain of unknown function (DUF222)/HNH endonuclease